MLLIKIPHFCGGSILTGLNLCDIKTSKRANMEDEVYHYETWLAKNLRISEGWNSRDNNDIGYYGFHAVCPEDKILFLKAFIKLVEDSGNCRPLIHSYLRPKGTSRNAYEFLEEIGFKKAHSYRNPNSGNVMDILVLDVFKVTGGASEISLCKHLKSLIQKEEAKNKPKTVATKLKTRFSKNAE